MTVLQPGDRIHLASPCSSVLYGRERQEEFERLTAEIRTFYASQQVQVLFISFNNALTAPVVVAVFRQETTR